MMWFRRWGLQVFLFIIVLAWPFPPWFSFLFSCNKRKVFYCNTRKNRMVGGEEERCETYGVSEHDPRSRFSFMTAKYWKKSKGCQNHGRLFVRPWFITKVTVRMVQIGEGSDPTIRTVTTRTHQWILTTQWRSCTVSSYALMFTSSRTATTRLSWSRSGLQTQQYHHTNG